MSDVLIRDLPEDELAEVKAAAAASGRSLQSYLRSEVLHAHVVYLRRLRAIESAARRLAGRHPLPDESRQAAFDAAGSELEAAGK